MFGAYSSVGRALALHGASFGDLIKREICEKSRVQIPIRPIIFLMLFFFAIFDLGL
jgi:hypothetical protein